MDDDRAVLSTPFSVDKVDTVVIAATGNTAAIAAATATAAAASFH